VAKVRATLPPGLIQTDLPEQYAPEEAIGAAEVAQPQLGSD
jgi:hypothetical protein